jgi:cytoskeletal protein CcmA (bactofilin family)
MSNLKERHDKAMVFAEQAISARREGNARRAEELDAQAFSEELAAVEIARSIAPPRALSVLQRSAATLALKCGKNIVAERLVVEALGANPPADIAQELEDLLAELNVDSTTSSAQGAHIGQAIEIQGKISFMGRLSVDGLIAGDINSRGTLIVGPHGRIEGNVRCTSIVIFGQVKGDIVARGRCELKCEGVLQGDIKAARLILEEGATFVGRSEIFARALQIARPEIVRENKPEIVRYEQKPASAKAYH